MTFKEWDRQQQEADSACGCLVAILAAMLIAVAVILYQFFK